MPGFFMNVGQSQLEFFCYFTDQCEFLSSLGKYAPLKFSFWLSFCVELSTISKEQKISISVIYNKIRHLRNSGLPIATLL